MLLTFSILIICATTVFVAASAPAQVAPGTTVTNTVTNTVNITTSGTTTNLIVQSVTQTTTTTIVIPTSTTVGLFGLNPNMDPIALAIVVLVCACVGAAVTYAYMAKGPKMKNLPTGHISDGAAKGQASE